MMPAEGGRAIDLFVSYAKKDAFETAFEVVVDLERRGLSCWIAPRDIPAGASWPAEIAKNIRRSQSFLLLLSDGANASEEIEKELNEAARQRKTLFVIRLAEIEPSDGLGYHLNRVQWLDLFRSRETVFNEITARVRALQGVAAAPPKQEISASARSDEGRIEQEAPVSTTTTREGAAPAVSSPQGRGWTKPALTFCAALALVGAGWGFSYAMRDKPRSEAVAPAPAIALAPASAPVPPPAPTLTPASDTHPPEVKPSATPTSETQPPEQKTSTQPAIAIPKPASGGEAVAEKRTASQSNAVASSEPEFKKVDPVTIPSAVQPPAIDPPPPVLAPKIQPDALAATPPDLAQSIRSELVRTACSSRAIEPGWNAAEMAPDLRRFAKALNAHSDIVKSLPPTQAELFQAIGKRSARVEASLDLRDLLHAAPDRLCPPVCSANEILKDGVCVAKPVASADDQRTRTTPAARRSEPKPANRGRHCFSAGGTSFCE